jgi:LssY C-terminus
VTRVGLGVRHETAELELDFDQLHLPGGQTIPVSTQVADVDNSRERVTHDGRIHGVRSTGSMCYRVSGYIRTALEWEVHAELAEWIFDSLIMELPEPEIYYPPGVELTLVLTQPLKFAAATPAEPAPGSGLTENGREDLERLVSSAPYRTEAPRTGRPGDFTNVLLMGSEEQISAAFLAAGWTQPGPRSLRDNIGFIRAVAELRGDRHAPMSRLLLNGADPTLSWEKGLNDVSKRHHIRIWKSSETWDGREVWVGAATRDIDFEYWHPGRKLSHRIDGDVDQERDKVAYDLAFSNCGSILEWAGRSGFPSEATTATGDPINSDGRMAVVELNDCESPRFSTETDDDGLLRRHGNVFQRFARREILGARNDLLRTNPYWRGFEGSRLLAEYLWRRKHRSDGPVLAKDQPAAVPHKYDRLVAFLNQ